MTNSLHGFRRFSLAEQAAETLYKAIASGELSDPLPGEVQLSETLKVSRPTLRQAMAILVKKGVIVTSKGKRTRIVHRDTQSSAPLASVCFIVSASLRSATMTVSALLDSVKLELTAKGIAWDAIYESQLGSRQPESRLGEMVAGRPKTCYVLLNSSRRLQQWFARSGQPVLVMGSCHEGIDLPSIDLDYRAVGWHAAGQFVKQGHKNLLLVEPMDPAVGFVASEIALKEYLSGVEGARLQVLRAPPDEFLTAFGRILRGPDAPTAALACRVEMAISVLGCVQQFGKSIPMDFSLIARDDHPIFEVMAPEITRYRCNINAMARKAVRLMRWLLQGVTPRNKTTLIVPSFFAGQTLRAISQ